MQLFLNRDNLDKYAIFILFPDFSSLLNVYTGSQTNERTRHLSRSSLNIN